jgi:hypothetical protein
MSRLRLCSHHHIISHCLLPNRLPQFYHHDIDTYMYGFVVRSTHCIHNLPPRFICTYLHNDSRKQASSDAFGRGRNNPFLDPTYVCIYGTLNCPPTLVHILYPARRIRRHTSNHAFVPSLPSLFVLNSHNHVRVCLIPVSSSTVRPKNLFWCHLMLPVDFFKCIL